MLTSTRREFITTALAGLAFAPTRGAGRIGIDSLVGGVRLGGQSYSFRELTMRPSAGASSPEANAIEAVNTVIRAFEEVGLGDCELWAPQVEPIFGPSSVGATRATPEQARVKARDELRGWRLKTPLDFFRDIKRRFDAAGVTISAYNYSFNDTFSDEEIDRGFEMARALGAEIITASTTLRAAGRVVPFAAKHRMVVAMHGHSNTTDPNEFATPESFAAAMKMSPYFKVNLDIGHFTAANYDPVAYIRENHARITNIHLKDRRRNQGDNVPWGQGDTPIRDVLQLLKKERWPVRAHVEYEYRGQRSPIEEVKTCVAYARQALA
jgi:sugar phosphate isomerase/epimerase